MSTNWIEWRGITPQCHSCCADRTNVNIHIMWANQHGGCMRIFCQRCGAWWDVKNTVKTEGPEARNVRMPTKRD